MLALSLRRSQRNYSLDMDHPVRATSSDPLLCHSESCGSEL